jgi:hypothetical protein
MVEAEQANGGVNAVPVAHDAVQGLREQDAAAARRLLGVKA